MYAPVLRGNLVTTALVYATLAIASAIQGNHENYAWASVGTILQYIYTVAALAYIGSHGGNNE